MDTPRSARASAVYPHTNRVGVPGRASRTASATSVPMPSGSTTSLRRRSMSPHRRRCSIAAAHGVLDAHLVAEVRQRSPGERRDRGLVVDHQDRLGPSGPRAGIGVGAVVGPRADQLGQQELDRGPDARRRREPDVAAGLADEVAHHREPEPGAAAGLLGREERLEHASQHVVRHAAAGVGHGDGHERSGDRGVVRDVPAGQARAAGRDGDRPAVGHRIARVDGEVDDGLLQLARVDPRDQRVGRLPDVDDDVAEQAVEHGLERVHGRPDVDDRRLERRPPREREQLARELARPVDDVDDGRGIRADRVGVGRLVARSASRTRRWP